MSSLILNEFIKTFKKKGFVVLIIIMFAFTLLTNMLYKYIDIMMDSFDEDSYIEQEYEFAKGEYEQNKNDKYTFEWYVSKKADYDIYLLKNKYEKDSWQYAYIGLNNDISTIIYDINSYELGLIKDKQVFDEAKVEYNKFIEKLNNSDWKSIVKEEKLSLEKKLKQIDDAIKKAPTNSKNEVSEDTVSDFEEIESYESLDSISLEDLESNKKSIEIQIETLNIQLEQNISYSDSEKYTSLMWYSSVKQALIRYDGKVIDRLSKEEKEDYYELRSDYFIIKNIIENNQYSTDVTLADMFGSFYDAYLLMIVIFIFMITGPIVSQEFSKGTIKMLLLKPYSRSKILLSKYIVSLLSVILAIVIMFVFQIVIGGLIFGFGSLSDDIVVYSNITDSAVYINILKYFVLMSISKLPQFIILSTLTFAASSIFNNTAVSIITGFVGYMGTNILNPLLQQVNKPFIKFFIGFNWDFKPYIFNLKPSLDGLSFGLSIMVCIVSILILIIPSFMVFKHKDIKNV